MSVGISDVAVLLNFISLFGELHIAASFTCPVDMQQHPRIHSIVLLQLSPGSFKTTFCPTEFCHLMARASPHPY